MKVTSISYHKTFNLGNYSSHKIGVEVDVEEDNVEDAMAEAKLLVEKFHAESIQPTIPQFDTATNPYNGQTGTQERIVQSVQPDVQNNVPNQVQNNVQPLTKEQKQEAMIKNYIETIKIAKTERAVLLYTAAVKKYNNPELTEAYNNKLSELQKQPA